MKTSAARLTFVLISAGLTAASGAVGFAIGRQTIPDSQLFTLAEAATGELTQRLELASLLRTGGSEAALDRIEEQIDSLVVSLRANGVDRQVLAPAKAYRLAVPPVSERRQDVDIALGEVPAARIEHCATALRAFLERNRKIHGSETRVAAVAPGQAAPWASIVPQVTTQADLTTRFGPPDAVVATFPWTEWSAVWKKRPVSTSYILRFTRPTSRSPLMEGPAGPRIRLT